MQKPPKTINSKTIHKNNFVEVKVDIVEANGKRWDQTYFTKPNKNGVGILPIDDKGIYLVNQYRHASKAFLWQIPMGMIDIGATPLETAKNELLEEMGLVANKLIKIGALIAEPGMSNQKTFVYIGENLIFKKQQPELYEVGMQVKHFTYEEIKKMIKDEKLVCGFTLSSLYLFHNNYLDDQP